VHRRLAMDTLTEKCMPIDTVGSFCDCIGGEETADPAAQAFCNRAETDTKITDEDLADLKTALTDEEEEECCECECGCGC
jgi:hypothetical protein